MALSRACVSLSLLAMLEEQNHSPGECLALLALHGLDPRVREMVTKSLPTPVTWEAFEDVVQKCVAKTRKVSDYSGDLFKCKNKPPDDKKYEGGDGNLQGFLQ